MHFQQETIKVNGLPVALLSAGSGPPLVFFHGAGGGWHGFDFAEHWVSRFRVLIPYHPGWGDSPDAPEITTVDDYVLHYLEMFDQLGLEKPHLVGHSMGGRFAASFAIHHRRRVNKLVLIAPAGLVVPDYPMADFSQVPPEEIPRYLVEDFNILQRHFPKEPSPAFNTAREREGGNFGKLMQNGLLSPWLGRWLHRINMPTQIVWGDKDRILPFGQAEAWRKLIPGSQLLRVSGVGHLPLDERPESSKDVADFLAA